MERVPLYQALPLCTDFLRTDPTISGKTNPAAQGAGTGCSPQSIVAKLSLSWTFFTQVQQILYRVKSTSLIPVNTLSCCANGSLTHVYFCMVTKSRLQITQVLGRVPGSSPRWQADFPLFSFQCGTTRLVGVSSMISSHIFTRNCKIKQN